MVGTGWATVSDPTEEAKSSDVCRAELQHKHLTVLMQWHRLRGQLSPAQAAAGAPAQPHSVTGHPSGGRPDPPTPSR